MGNALGMRGQRTHFNALSGFVVPGHVVEHFVGVQIGVVVGNLDGFVVEIQGAGAKGANHEVVGFESLVGRGGHVVFAHNRTEVINVESVRVVAAIPAHHIQRVVVIDVLVDAMSCFDAHFELSRFVERQREFGTAQVALAIRRVFEELAGLLRNVARWRADMRSVCGFNDHDSRAFFAFGGVVEDQSVDRAFGNDEVVAFPEGDRSELGVQRSFAKVNKDAFVTHRIVEVVIHPFFWNADAHFAVRVAKEHHAARDGVPLGRQRHALHMSHPHCVHFHILRLGAVQGFPAHHLGRGMDVVHGGRGANKAFGAEDLFGIQPAIGATELDVSLGGKLSQCSVIRHGQILKVESNLWIPIPLPPHSSRLLRS